VESDLELLERWRAGEREAGEALFARHFADIFRFFEGKVAAKAEDLTQQTFLECTRSRQQFRGDSSFRTYLFGIAWNELRQHIRREVKGVPIDFDVSTLDEVAALMTSPSSHVDRARRADRVRQALAKLPICQQVLLEYHYWHDLEAPALAEIFGAKAGAIRVRLLRARAGLRDQLARLGAGKRLAAERDIEAAGMGGRGDDRWQPFESEAGTRVSRGSRSRRSS
jgi:RNA polymerase sigma factor (sigma-70 family)